MSGPSGVETEFTVDEATEKLAGLATRPGYQEALRPTVPDTTYRVIIVLAVVTMGALATMGWFYVESRWLRYLVTIAFGGLCLFFLASLFSRSSPTATLAGHPRAVVVVSRTPSDSGGGRIHFLAKDGSTLDVTADPALFEMLTPGDAGIALVSGVGPALDLTSFRRL